MAENTNEYRFKNSTRNAMTAVITQVFMGVASFVERMVFNQCFITDYLGFYSLFRNVISVFAVAELGLSVAIAYALYAPFAQDDYEEITAILYFFKKIYRTVGTLILVCGLVFMAFIQYFVKTDVSISSVRIYFLVFLLTTVAEYWFYYKSILFSASQKEYITTLLTNFCWAAMYCVQIAVSILTHSFLLYSICMFAFTLIRCVAVNIIADKQYSFIKRKAPKLSKESRKKILLNVKGLIATKVGGVISDSTNGVLISAMIGSTILGMYSNYQMITRALSGFIKIIPNAVTASLGNIGATESSDNVANTFHYIDTCLFILYGLISIVLINIINPIISIFFGADRCMSDFSALLICLLFYLNNIENFFTTYKSSLGLYWYDRYRPIIAGISDLFLSLILGSFIGFDGIILGTIIVYIFINLWYESLIIFHHGFNKSSRKYIASTMLRLALIVLMMIATLLISKMIPGNGLLNLFARAVISLTISIAIFLLIYHKNIYVINSLKAIKTYILKKKSD